MKNNIICVIPVYNESDIVIETVNSLSQIKSIDEIILVNDGSTDNTLKKLKKLNTKLISYEKNRGKGYAIKKAIKDIDYTHLVLVDGDLGKSSYQVKKLIDSSLREEGDLIIAKFPDAKKVTNKKGGIGLVKNLAKKGVTFFTGETIETSLSGQRVYKKEVIDKIDFIPDRYGIEVAMTIQTLNNNFTIKEVPVNMSHRYTGRDIKGFMHRGRQFKDILKTFIIMYFKGYRR